MYSVVLTGQTVKTTKTGVLCTEMCLLTLHSPLPATTSKRYKIPTALKLDQRICMSLSSFTVFIARTVKGYRRLLILPCREFLVRITITPE